MIKKSFFILITFFFLNILHGQDPQFSQFYNSSLFTNPAFTGTGECFKVGTNSRTQWLGLTRAFNTTLIYGDVNYETLNSGFGFMVLYDQIGRANLSSLELSGLYSYHLDIAKDVHVSLGLQGTYARRSIDYSRLLFEDQFTDLAVTEDITADPVRFNTSVQYFDLSSGLLIYGKDLFWLGASFHHINEPEQAFFLSPSKLPVRISIHGGLKFEKIIKKAYGRVTHFTVYPSILYKREVRFDQADYGVYFFIDKLMLGMFYRGVFFENTEGIVNNDALSFHLGFTTKGWNFYYSYDFTTSRLKVQNTLGSHELSISKTFCLGWPYKKKTPKSKRYLPCPEFKPSIRHKDPTGLGKKKNPGVKNKHRHSKK